MRKLKVKKNTLPYDSAQVSIASTIVMVRPSAFGFNAETADSNRFQEPVGVGDVPAIAMRAREEFDRMVEMLRAHDVDVHVFDDTPDVPKPDAVFPNNWISFHPDGKVIIYPMMAQNRRAERRMDIVEALRKKFTISSVVDLSGEEQRGLFLEGTGSVVYDHANRLLFAAVSPRTSEALAREVAAMLRYRPVIFDAVDERGVPVYHTNVMMAIGSRFAVICLDAIPSGDQQDEILGLLAGSGRKVISISHDQMRAFAGNLIEVNTLSGDAVVLMSQSGFDSLLPGQLNAIALNAEVLPLSVKVIEKHGGGSVRCMITDVHLPVAKSQ